MSSVAFNLYQAAEVRALDRCAIEEHGIPGYELMQRAAAAAYAVLSQRWPAARRLLVLCGAGNNGGDGFVLARLAQAAGQVVEVIHLGDSSRLQGDALRAWTDWQAAGGATQHGWSEAPGRYDVVVDALLGTGLQRAVQGNWRAAIEWVNSQDAPVLALDIPSGLDADTGAVWGVAVRARVTVSFIAWKRGLYTGEGREYCGTLVLHELGVPPAVYAKLTPGAELLHDAWCSRQLGRRPRTSHKGAHGHVLVVGGAAGMAGAVCLAGEAALRTGAGLVSVATHPGHAAVLTGVRPELMIHGVRQATDLAPLLRRATVVAVGPGLGQSPWAQTLLAQVLDSGRPLVVDADALNLVALSGLESRTNWMLTPHPGEAGRLLGCSSATVQQDRFQAVAALRARYGGIVVLKGAGTLIAGAGQPIAVCPTGNPGMASAGFGDVLTGMVAGLVAQGLRADIAVKLAVWSHGRAADEAAEADGERGMLARDLMPYIRRLVNAHA